MLEMTLIKFDMQVTRYSDDAIQAQRTCTYDGIVHRSLMISI